MNLVLDYPAANIIGDAQSGLSGASSNWKFNHFVNVIVNAFELSKRWWSVPIHTGEMVHSLAFGSGKIRFGCKSSSSAE